ncbi:hypothetical protein K469DRAFT_722049 [Zopfia rhizophila CBS 207.26]|uniref:Uncharacterized protein n=1 Tax=Zopfia rhizophila CBS 207.26 TaxID=1314779 RepID=A0A6A6DCD5_9PEZI|nr:hypothetical protein K469DRAFT_722049 [Zopfia rhizophila CBS 207.26]
MNVFSDKLSLYNLVIADSNSPEVLFHEPPSIIVCTFSTIPGKSGGLNRNRFRDLQPG